MNQDRFQIHMQRLQTEDPQVLETLYTLGNGHLGVRASNPLQGNSPAAGGRPGLFVNGFYDMTPIDYGETYFGYALNNQTISQLPDPRFVILEVDGLRSDRVPFGVRLVDKNLDMSSGLLLETFEITAPSGKMIRLAMKSFVSQQATNLFVVSYAFTAMNFSGNISVLKQHGYVDQQLPQVKNDVRAVTRNLQLDRTFIETDFPTMRITTRKSQLALLMAARYLGEDPDMSYRIVDDVPSYGGDIGLTPGLTRTFDFAYAIGHPHSNMNMTLNQEKYVSAIHEHLDHQSFTSLLQESATVMAQFWADSNIELDGDPTLDVGIRFNLFHLFQAAGRDGHTSIGAKGLTGQGYEGHYFWDTEMFMLPFFTYTQPAIAKQVLTYRYSKLDQARARAREMGVDNGVLFPWRTINGDEASAYYPAGTAQMHINADIAYAADTYFRVTGDKDFLSHQGIQLMMETARYWMAYGHYGTRPPARGKFTIEEVTGPDEYTALVNNNYYTNRMAKHNLTIAVNYAAIIQQDDASVLQALGVTTEELAAMTEAAKNMYLPYDENLEVKMQDDSAFNKPIWPIETTPRDHYPLLLHYHPLTLYRYQVNKQPDTLMSDFLFPFDQDDDHLKRDYDYYEAITVHDSSLSRAIFGILAHRIHDAQKSYQYFMDTALMDLTNSQGNTADGIHAANMGGTWLGLIYGFAGMIMTPKGLEFNPELPNEWQGLTFNIQYLGRRLHIVIHQQTIAVTLQTGKKVTITINHHTQTLVPKKTVTVSLKKN